MQSAQKKIYKLTVLLGLIVLSVIVGASVMGRYATETAMPVTQVAMELETVSHKTAKARESIEEHIEQLKELDLWEIGPDTKIPPVVFAGYPTNFQQQRDIPTRKKVFLHTLLPVALVALHEVEQERLALLEIISQTGQDPEQLFFSVLDGSTSPAWQAGLTQKQIECAFKLAKKYRTAKAVELLDRVDIIPVSLIMAQGAMESSWGRSRFAREANNLFGVWTWKEPGLIPMARDAGKSHKIKIYGSILDSVRGYVLNLNRHGAYENLRQIRRQTYDSLSLAEGLLYYSEKRAVYVNDIRRIISSNRLIEYDGLSLLPGSELSQQASEDGSFVKRAI